MKIHHQITSLIGFQDITVVKFTTKSMKKAQNCHIVGEKNIISPRDTFEMR